MTIPRNDLTRRSLLALLAGAGAASASRPGEALAAMLRPDRLPADGRTAAAAGGPGGRGAAAERRAVHSPDVFELSLGDLRRGLHTVSAPAPFDLVGVGWHSPASAGIELRTERSDGRWGHWGGASTLGHAPEGGELERSAATRSGRGGGRLLADPVWVGRSKLLQLRCDAALKGVRLHFVNSGAQPLAEVAAMRRAHPLLDAGGGQPPILARSSWAGNRSHPRFAPEYGSVKLAFVHHTENPNGYTPAEVPAMLRSIFVFHRDVRGWNDIGYNFVIDLFGRIFEARAGGIDEPVLGAQAGGYNEVSTGVAVLGDFQSMRISKPAQRALERLLAWKLSLHGVPVRGHVTVRVDPAGAVYSRYPANAEVTLPRVAGHRDADATDCPGNALYGELPVLRRAASQIAGKPCSIEMRMHPAPPAEGEGAPPQPAGEGTPPQPAGEGTPPQPEAEQGGAAQPEAGQAPSAQPEAGAGAPAPGPSTSEPQQPGGVEPGGAEPGGAEPGGAEPGGAEPGGAEPGGAGEGEGMRLAGRLARLGAGPIAGARIEVQVRSVSHHGLSVHERTVATVTTDEDGRFSAEMTVKPPHRERRRRKHSRHPRHRKAQTPTIALRALFRGEGGAPACVSEPIDVKGTLIGVRPLPGPTR